MDRPGTGKAGIALLVLAGALATAGPASALKLGKPAPDVGGGESCGSCNAFQHETAPSSPSYVVPSGDWKIKSWKAAGNKHGKGEARLRIYRPTGTTDQYQIVDQSPIRRFPAGEITKHRAKIEVEGGDHLGIVGVGSFPSSYDSNKGADVIGHPTATANCIIPTIGDTVGGGGDCDLAEFAFARVNIAVRIKPIG